MSFLLDTHVLLWLEGGSPKLSRRVVDLISTTDQSIFVSAATFWEIAIKRRSGKLVFRGSVRGMVAAAGFTELAIGADDGELAGALDWEHKDPFDRMLVAQCRDRGLSLVTSDAALRGRIEIPIVWAA